MRSEFKDKAHEKIFNEIKNQSAAEEIEYYKKNILNSKFKEWYLSIPKKR